MFVLVPSEVGATVFKILSIVSLFCMAFDTAVVARSEPQGNDTSTCSRQSSQQSTEHRSHRHDEVDDDGLDSAAMVRFQDRNDRDSKLFPQTQQNAGVKRKLEICNKCCCNGTIAQVVVVALVNAVLDVWIDVIDMPSSSVSGCSSQGSLSRSRTGSIASVIVFTNAGVAVVPAIWS